MICDPLAADVAFGGDNANGTGLPSALSRPSAQTAQRLCLRHEVAALSSSDCNSGAKSTPLQLMIAPSSHEGVSGASRHDETDR